MWQWCLTYFQSPSRRIQTVSFFRPDGRRNSTRHDFQVEESRKIWQSCCKHGVFCGEKNWIPHGEKRDFALPWWSGCVFTQTSVFFEITWCATLLHHIIHLKKCPRNMLCNSFLFFSYVGTAPENKLAGSFRSIWIKSCKDSGEVPGFEQVHASKASFCTRLPQNCWPCWPEGVAKGRLFPM